MLAKSLLPTVLTGLLPLIATGCPPSSGAPAAYDRAVAVGGTLASAPGDPASVRRTAEAERPEPPREITNAFGMKLIRIAPGEFSMGSPSGEEGRNSDEGAYRVRITRAYYIGATEVTQAQFRSVMGENPSRYEGDNLPVECVSFDQVQEFLRRLSGREGKTYRLPTEAEWEYACRAGSTTPFAFGGTISTDQANYNGLEVYGAGRKGLNRRRPIAVASLAANGWGLYDMHGNVYEWCQDWHTAYPSGTRIDPQGPGAGTFRVLRGGSFRDWPETCRSANRYRYIPNRRYTNIGFRAVLVP